MCLSHVGKACVCVCTHICVFTLWLYLYDTKLTMRDVENLPNNFVV